MATPPYPRHLSLEERGAILEQTARAMVDAAIKDSGSTRSYTAQERSDLEQKAKSVVSMNWLIERVAALEAEAATRRKPRGPK